MSKVAVETVFGNLPSYQRGVAPYTSSALGLGPTMMQNNGIGAINDWVGPLPPQVIRPFEYNTSTIAGLAWAMTWPSSSTDWIFYSDNSTAAATRKIMYATLNRGNGAFTIAGIITVVFPIATNITVRGFGMEYLTISTGSITISSGSFIVTGSSTLWADQGACSGNRIGFGSVVPSQISQWYEITGSNTTGSSHNPSALGSNTSLVLTTPAAQTYPTGTAYVIEDLRAHMYTTNATPTNGGVFVVKGLRPEIFSSTGVGVAAVSASNIIDNARACYWLADAASLNNTASIGHASDPSLYNFTTHSIWVMDTISNPVLFNYNIRKPLFLTAGKDTASLILRTGNGGAPTGTPSQVDNLVLATMGNGSGSGSACLYFTTTTRVYRTAAVSTITSGSIVWLSGGDVMQEIPPGSTNTFGASSLLNTIEYSGLMDKLIIGVNSTTTPFRNYITNYYSSPTQMDRVWGIDTRQIDETTADNNLPAVPSFTGTNWSINSNNGISYLGSTNTGAGSAILTRAYAVPLGADWEYAAASGCRIVTPAINTPNCNYYTRFYASTAGNSGGATGNNFGLSAEDWRAYYRTNGISNDTGTWILIDKSGDMSGIAGASQIQFMFEFRTFGTTHIPDRIFNCGIIYQDTNTDTHYQPSVAFTNLTTKTFAWRFANAWGSTVPNLKVTLYDAVAGGTLLTDTTALSASGVWAKSINNGLTFGVYDNNDYVNTGSYITYTPTSLADNIKVQASLTQN